MDFTRASPAGARPVATAKSPLLGATEKARLYHGRIPYLRKLPVGVVAIILGVILLNAVAWAGIGVVLHFNRPLLGTAILAYTLGLRHALDADHIAAIDLMTRRLIASGQRPIAVGFFFSLGHSTIVVITSIAVAATSAALSSRFDEFSRVGGIIGTSVSAAFIIVLAVINAWVLWRLWGQMKAALQREREMEMEGNRMGEEMERDLLAGALVGGGCLVRVFKGAFKIVDRSWKMYPLGILFGLGFDTSSEVALLGIASIQAAKGTSIWLILIFPILFTVGMCLLDTIDGALMSALYQSSTFSNDYVAILYYSIVLTVITVIVAIVIGVIQLLNLIYNVVDDPTGRFWEGVEKLGEWYDVVGGCVVALFVVGAVVSVLCFKPWRRWAVGKGKGRSLVVTVDDEGIDSDVGRNIMTPGKAGERVAERDGDRISELA